MREEILEQTLWLPRPRAEVFPFFADAQNLECLTPPWLHFQILTPLPISMQVGTWIDYRLRVHGVPLRWRTRIEVWDPPAGFVDVQVHGPYRLWHHTHRFEEREGGTLCLDRVRYWPRGGAWVNRLFVRHDVRRIFAYRARVLRERLGAAPAPTAAAGP